jgi:hypothetical protein
MRENEKAFFLRLRNKHPVKRIVVVSWKLGHCLRMGKTDRQLGNPRFATESIHLLSESILLPTIAQMTM